MIDDSIFTNSVSQSLWECPIWHRKTTFGDSFNKELLKELYGIACRIKANTDTINGKSLLDYDSPYLVELIMLKTSVITSVVNQYFPLAHEAMFRPISSWLNVNGPGDRIELHAHPDSSIACTYYIQAPDDGGEFYYVDTGKVGEHKSEVKCLRPEAGDLIFFPSYVLHGVNKNLGRLRISLSTDFNYALTDDSKDKLELKSFVDSMLRIGDV